MFPPEQQTTVKTRVLGPVSGTWRTIEDLPPLSAECRKKRKRMCEKGT